MEVLNSNSNDDLQQMNQNEQQHRDGAQMAPRTMYLNIELERSLNNGFERKTTRSRSNSKVYRQSLPPPVNNNTKSSSSSHNGTSIQQKDSQDTQPTKPHSRDQYTHIIRLSSLNETFDRKTLAIPAYPEVLKLGRPNSSQKAPNIDNGYFDSKVISREQAELYVKCDQVFIRDKNSSNGTFVNTKKILQEEPVKENDVIDLGIDIDGNQSKHQHHRKISCKVDSIFVVPLNNGVSLPQVLNDLNNQDKVMKQKEVTPFDAAFFGDVNSDLDDLALGMDHDFLSGIFVNNNIGTSSNLTKSVKILMNQLHQEKVNNLKLQSVETFLENYRVELSRNEQTAKIRKLNKELSDYKKLAEVSKSQISTFEEKIGEITSKLESNEKTVLEKDEQIKELEASATKHNETITNELNSKIESQDALIKEKQARIESLTKEQQSIKSNYESNLKLLEDKLSTNSEDYQKLKKKYKSILDYKKQNDMKNDFYNLILVSTGILIIGLLVLKVF